MHLLCDYAESKQLVLSLASLAAQFLHRWVQELALA